MASMADDLRLANTKINDAEHEIRKIHDWINKFCTMRPIYSDEKIAHMKVKNQARNMKRKEQREEKSAMKRDAEGDRISGG